MEEKNRKDRKASMIAAAVTLGAALVILLLLFILTVGDSRRALAEASMPEMQDDEEIFLEPELLVVDNPGDESSQTVDEPAPQTPGEPDPAEEEQPVKVVKNTQPPKEKPVSNKPELVASNTQAEITSSPPKLTEEESRRIASIGGKLKTDNNGARAGSESADSGSGGNGIAASGNVNGRKMISCPTWKLRLAQKTVVKVSITVDADGNVTSASAVSGGTPNLRKECERMAKGSKWTKKEGAKPATGTISFTVYPN